MLKKTSVVYNSVCHNSGFCLFLVFLLAVSLRPYKFYLSKKITRVVIVQRQTKKLWSFGNNRLLYSRGFQCNQIFLNFINWLANPKNKTTLNIFITGATLRFTLLSNVDSQLKLWMSSFMELLIYWFFDAHKVIGIKGNWTNTQSVSWWNIYCLRNFEQLGTTDKVILQVFYFEVTMKNPT